MAAAEPDNFLEQKRTTSEIKDKILPAYFRTWCNIHLNVPGSQSSETLLFIDTNAGEGYITEGQSTAILSVLENIHQNALSESDSDQIIKTFFINPTQALTEKLTANLEQLPFYPALLAAPEVLTETAFQERIIDAAPANQPALIFLDPTRPALTRQLLAQARQSNATDVLLIFNFNKLRQALLSDEPDDWENNFWGNWLEDLNNYNFTQTSAKKRESYFLQTLASIFKDAGFYTFSFLMLPPGKNPASQYLLLFTKSLRGYLGIKNIMQAYSEYQEDGVPLFRVTNKPPVPLLPGFFQYLSKYTLNNLTEELARSRSQFHYKTLQAIYEEHSIGTNYIKANYLAAFEKLRTDGVLYPIDAHNKKVKAFSDTSVIFYNLHRSKK